MAMETEKFSYVDELKIPDLKQFLTKGIPQVTFQRVFRSESTLHTSDHDPVDSESQNCILNVFADNGDLWMDRKYLRFPSIILARLMPLKNQIMTSCEREIFSFVSQTIHDAITIAGLSGEVSPLGEYSATVELNSRRNTHSEDFYVVARNDGRPLLILVVRSPRLTSSNPSSVSRSSLLDEPRLVGQLTDYMLDVTTYSGQEDVFGITTTSDEWKFHWFEHSSDVAVASTTAELAALRPAGELPAERPCIQRRMCSTRIFHHTDSTLPMTIVAVLHKAYRSRTFSTRVPDPQRLYLSLSANTWSWRHMAESELAVHHDRLTLLHRPDIKSCTTFTVLRYFQKRPDRRVWLCVAGQNPGCLLVVKQFDTDAAAELEQDCWRRVNDCETWLKDINGLPALCMPLVFLACQDSGTGDVTFDFDLRSVCAHTDPDPTSFPVPLSQLAEDIATAGAVHTSARAVAEAAIERCAAQCIEHQDLRWRHVGLLPVVGDDDRLRELRPVLVDFGRCAEVAIVEAARASMRRQLFG